MLRHPALCYALFLSLLLPACTVVVRDEVIRIPVTVTAVAEPGVDLASFRSYRFAPSADGSLAFAQLRSLWAGWLDQRGLAQLPQDGQLLVEFSASLRPGVGAPDMVAKQVRVLLSRPMADGSLDLVWSGTAVCQSIRPGLLPEGQVLVRELAGEFPFASGKPLDRWAILR
jgi:hypothetical protein